MQQNRAVYQNTIRTKLRDTVFSAVVNECFIKALPFDRTEMDEETEHNLSMYALGVTESLGGFAALEAAIKSTTDPRKKTLLCDIARLCDETALEAATRIANKDDKTTEELVAPTLSDDEYSEFTAKADKLDIDRIAEIVKEKVLKTLKNEQEARVRNETVNAALREALDESKAAVDAAKGEDDDEDKDTEDDNDSKDSKKDEEEDKDSDTKDDESKDEEEDTDSDDEDSDKEDKDSDESDEDSEDDDKKDKKKDKDNEEAEDEDKDSKATESFKLLLAAGNPFARASQHKSFFTSITHAAMEQILSTADIGTLDPNVVDESRRDRLLDTTLESTLNVFSKTRTELNGVKEDPLSEARKAAAYVRAFGANESLTSDEQGAVAESAMVDAVCVYTMLESLHTMNLIKASTATVKAATESVASLQDQRSRVVNHLNASVTEATKLCLQPIKKVVGATRMTLIEDAQELMSSLESCLPEGEEFTTSHNNIAAATETLKTMYEQEDRRIHAKPATEGYFERRKREERQATLNRIALEVKRQSSPIGTITMEQAEGDPHIKVTLLDSLSRPVKTSTIVMEGVASTVEEIGYEVNESKLHGIDMPAVFYFHKDGNTKRTRICN